MASSTGGRALGDRALNDRGPTERDRAKADRQATLLRESARLFAERGFAGVSLEELGAAVGVSGPAVYRHFASKQALLGTILVRVSERLLAGGTAVVESTTDPLVQLTGLVGFHVEFALSDADVIRVHDRDLASLSDDDRRRVRTLQRAYVEIWIDVLRRLRPDADDAGLRVRAHACFGLLNSTPRSTRAGRGGATDSAMRDILTEMAVAALTA